VIIGNVAQPPMRPTSPVSLPSRRGSLACARHDGPSQLRKRHGGHHHCGAEDPGGLRPRVRGRWCREHERIPLLFPREYAEFLNRLARAKKGRERLATLLQFRLRMLRPEVALLQGLTDR